VVLYVARAPLARVFAGAIASPVAAALPVLALVTPIAVAGTLALYAVVSRDDGRGWVFVAYALGAVTNCILVPLLAPSHGGKGVVIACAAGLVITNLVLLARLAVLVRHLES
jgi:O-antigen/teichoic acid export membrane protein